MEPELLVVDELLTGLDTPTWKLFWRWADARCARGEMAMLYSTCIDRDADMADRVLLLDSGHMLAIDTPSALRARVAPEAAILRGPTAGGIRAHVGPTVTVDETPDGVVLRTGDVSEPLADLLRDTPAALHAAVYPRPTMADVCRSLRQTRGLL